MASTIGARYCSCKHIVEGETFVFDIWDTAGQERFHSLLPMYYRSANVIVICLDLSRQYDEARLEYWLERIAIHTDPHSCFTLLVGTKSDITCDDFRETEDIIIMNPATGRYETITVPTVLKGICNRNNMLYKPSSALTGEGVRELFAFIACSIVSMIGKRDDNDIVDIEERVQSWREWLAMPWLC
jgi:Ras-related protein Rab-5C